jgi:hypothetical protein
MLIGKLFDDMEIANKIPDWHSMLRSFTFLEMCCLRAKKSIELPPKYYGPYYQFQFLLERISYFQLP